MNATVSAGAAGFSELFCRHTAGAGGGSRWFLRGRGFSRRQIRRPDSSCACRFWLAAGTYNLLFFGEMDSRDPSRLLAELSQVLRERSDGAALRQGAVKAVQTTVFSGPA